MTDLMQADAATTRPAAEARKPTHDGANARIFWLHSWTAGPVSSWPDALSRVAGLGFSHVMLPPPVAGRDARLLEDPERAHPALGAGDAMPAVLAAIDAAVGAAGLGWMLDLRLDAVAAEGRLARERSDVFAAPDPRAPLDPFHPDLLAALRPGEAAAAFWAELLGRWARAGAAGFRLDGLATLGPQRAAALLRDIRGRAGSATLIGTLDEVPVAELPHWGAVGLDTICVSFDRLDEETPDALARAAAASALGRLMLAVERPFQRRPAARLPTAARHAAIRRRLQVAARLGDGWLVPEGFLEGTTRRTDPRASTPAPLVQDLAPDIVEAVRQTNASPLPAGKVTVLPALGPIRGFRRGEELTVVNAGPVAAAVPLVVLAPGMLAENGPVLTLPAGEARSVTLSAAPPIRQSRPARPESGRRAAQAERVAIEAVTPSVDDGRFAAKRLAGQSVTVEADLICEGHDKLAGLVQWRRADVTHWRETRMTLVANDRWRAEIDLPAVGRFVMRIVAWRDAFATFRDELAKKLAAGVDVTLEVQEGRALVAEALPRDRSLDGVLAELDKASDTTARATILLAHDLAARMEAADSRPLATTSRDYPIAAERPAAAFSSWYEIFPRSMSDDPERHGTFRDVIRHLPRIRDMGFSVLYFPPINPIGTTNRKGRNNALRAEPGDPGSPYAIGSPAGGHRAIHPELGTLRDFLDLRDAAAQHGLELALDFAIQCSPDHPWLTRHPGWFAHRPDGSIRYAENPPKKYEDIVNVDFYGKGAIPDLWVALAETVLLWCGHGVRIFRVDNPHTKPLPFWEWLIDEVQAQYPDAIFLAEAFTKPKMMNRLGKLGFTQSYTYFTWRNTAREMQEYLTELTTSQQREFFRPNFFVNTPDINPVFLQTSGRAGFLIRAALAATLAGNWGVYCGFELCESSPVPGREEYLDSEKYQIRTWDWDRPGNIVAEITALNQVRRRHPALWSHLGVTFLPSDDDQVLFFEKATEDRSDVMLVAVSFDPRGFHSAAIQIPLWRWGLPDQGSLVCHDALHDTRFTLTGKHQRVALSPEAPYTIWHARPAA